VTGIAPDEAANGIMLVATLPGHLAEHLAEAAGTRTVAGPAEIGPVATPCLGTPRLDHDPAQRWLRRTIADTLKNSPTIAK